MSVEDLMEREDICLFEEKYIFFKESEDKFRAKYPLQLATPTARGAFGGDVAAAALAVAYESVDKGFTAHAFHLFFLKACPSNIPLIWQVEKDGDGRSFCNRSVKGLKNDNGREQVVAHALVSFTRYNDEILAKKDYSKKETEAVPYSFFQSPTYFYKKYCKNIDDLISFNLFDGRLELAIPKDLFKQLPKEILKEEISRRRLGCFMKLNDRLDLASNRDRTKNSLLLFLSDVLFLSFSMVAMGVPFDVRRLTYFVVSLDHTVYIHDVNFDPTEWIYVEFSFPRRGNDRILCQCNHYNSNGVLVATVQQEALQRFPKALVDLADGGSYKL